MKTKNILLLLLLSGLTSCLFAQSPCDLVEITDIRYDAFNDTAILVQVSNNSPDIFDYPGFLLLDADGDTLAREVVNFFGLGAFHISSLAVHPGAVLPEGPFEGTLELWTGFYDDLACAFDISANLCPDTICHVLVFEFGNFGGAMILADYSYSITDNLGTVHATGAFTLEDTVQSFLNTLCLPSGNYELTLSTDDNPTGGQPYCSLWEVKSSWWASNFQFQFDQAASVTTRTFSLYGNCAPGINAVREAILPAPVHFLWTPDGVGASASEGEILWLTLYDLSGRQLARVEGPAASLYLPSGSLRGMYFAVARMKDGSMRSGKGMW